jgi:hypothetical protein
MSNSIEIVIVHWREKKGKEEKYIKEREPSSARFP